MNDVPYVITKEGRVYEATAFVDASNDNPPLATRVLAVRRATIRVQDYDRDGLNGKVIYVASNSGAESARRIQAIARGRSFRMLPEATLLGL